MNAEQLVAVNRDEVERQVAPIIAAAEALVVRNVDEHSAGLQLLGRVMDVRDRVKKLFKPSIDAAMEAKRKAEASRAEVVTLQDKFLAPVLEAQARISQTCAAFEEEERRAAKLNREALEREALAKQQEDRELDAAMADTDEQAEDALTEPLPPPMVPVVMPQVAKVAGVSTRSTWGHEIRDMAAFAQWCINTGNLYLLQGNEVALNGRARAEKDKMSIPGVRAVETLSHARR